MCLKIAQNTNMLLEKFSYWGWQITYPVQQISVELLQNWDVLILELMPFLSLPVNFQVPRSRELKEYCSHSPVKTGVHYPLPSNDLNPSLCCLCSIILQVKGTQVTGQSVPRGTTSGDRSFPNFLWAPWSHFYEVLFQICNTRSTHRCSTPTQFICLLCGCLCIKTMLALRAQDQEWLLTLDWHKTHGQCQPLLRRIQTSVQTFCAYLWELWLMLAPWRSSYIMRICLFWPSEYFRDKWAMLLFNLQAETDEQLALKAACSDTCA